MPWEDGLPTYAEVTGLERILPHNIAREITRTISEPEEGTGSSRTAMFWCLLVTGLAFGVLMTVVGGTTLTECPHSMLPTWLLGSGCSILAPFLYVFLFRVRSFLFQVETDGKPCCMPWLVTLLGIDANIGQSRSGAL